MIDSPEIHFCIFFDQPTLGDIGYRTSLSAYSREVLAATFNTHIDDLPSFPFTKADPLIVNRRNPVRHTRCRRADLSIGVTGISGEQSCGGRRRR